jgi:acyl-homoserine lactone acylase PvdQ
MRFKLASVALVIASALAMAPAASAKDFSIIARDILPGGQYGAIPNSPGGPTLPEAEQQAQMYNALTPLSGHVTNADLVADFKPEPLLPPSAKGLRNEPVPHVGVTVRRDSFDVPHIYGKTHDDVTWGAGWVTAEDRGLLLQQARYDSRVAAIDAPGLSAFNLITSLRNFKPSQQTEHEIAKQTHVLEQAGPKGRLVLHDIDVYVRGINAYLRATHQNVPPFTRTDIYAFNALKDQFVGEGGGDEARRAQFLASLQRRLGFRRGLAVYHDLREANDPESPASVPGHVNLLPPPRSTTGNVIPDAGSFVPIGSSTPLPSRAQASNILMVSGRRSSTHHPIMVAGPQIGYAYPGLILEMDLEGPGIHARGATTAPFPGYIFIGRSQDSAWSLTSAGLDEIDTYVETLCGHSRTRYLFRGRCRQMQRFDAGTLDPSTPNAREVTFFRTVHGPVIGYAKVHGRSVALSRKRSSYGRDVLDLLFYRDLTDAQVHNVHQFLRAANQTPQTFNSFYADDKDIGMFTSGLIPTRPRNVDPSLPIDGRGSEEWHGDATFKQHPMSVDPPSGEIINWNNRPEAVYQAPDDNWSLASIHRVDLLIHNVPKRQLLSPTMLVGAMNEAATQDPREMLFEPVLSKLLRTGPAPSPRAARMLALLDAWRRHGGSRLDRTGDGQITDPGAAILDGAWSRLATAWASSVLGPTLRSELNAIEPQFDYPFSGTLQPNGREMTKGWHLYMYKDLRTILGEPVRGKYNVRYCGRGNLARCRTLLWHALDAAGTALAKTQGPDPSTWREDATAEQISFVPGLLPFKMRYTNRPSGIQQVLSFFGHAKQDTGR